jgi:hypothetical protein
MHNNGIVSHFYVFLLTQQYKRIRYRSIRISAVSKYLKNETIKRIRLSYIVGVVVR